MNTNQLVSIVTLIIGFGSGWLEQKGFIDQATGEKLTAAIAALLIGVIAHGFHSTPPSPPPAKLSLPLMLLPFLLAGLLGFSGCASAPTTAYKAEAATDVTVSTAMTAWGDYVTAYHPPATEEAAVKAAFEKYQAAEILAIDATEFYAEETATNSTASNAGMSTASGTATQALADLVTLIKSFGVNL